MSGFHNAIAWIDLNNRTVQIRTIAQKDREQFLGGGSLGAAYLARMVTDKTDPLAPGNPLIFMTGPYTATRVPAASRHEVVSLSPLTGIYGEGNCGGSFGWHLKKSGLDGLVITGASKNPLSLIIDGQTVTFYDSADLWGMDTFSADEAIKNSVHPKAVTAVIGPAGEKLVKFASITHDGRHSRAIGRCGLGAVMGAKKLKALAIAPNGDLDTPVADPAGLKKSVGLALKNIREKLGIFGQLGTPGGVINYNSLGNLPVNNWRNGQDTAIAEKTTGTVMKDTIWVKRAGCKFCPIHCGRLVENSSGPFALDGIQEGPEYETLAAFGSLCLNDNLEAIAKANEICNRMGMDTISAGGVVAFAMECAEKNILSKKELGGIELAFGNPHAMIALLAAIALRKGEIPFLLGEGTRAAAAALGKGSEEYAVHVKGLEFPMHDPRFSWGHALSYATSNRGACHLSSLSHPFEMAAALPELGYGTPFPGREIAGKARWVMHLQHLMNLLDTLSICKFAILNNAVSLTNLMEWTNDITGSHLDMAGFMQIGERAFTLKRMINNQRGITRKDDILPPRMRTLRKTGEGFDFDVPPLFPMLSKYYELRGWTEEGRPGKDILQKLGLNTSEGQK